MNSMLDDPFYQRHRSARLRWEEFTAEKYWQAEMRLITLAVIEDNEK